MSAWRRLGAPCLAAIAALLLAAPAVQAEWRTVSVPGGQILNLVAADADVWLVDAPGVCCPPTYHVTKDQGAHWTPVQVPGFNLAWPVGAAADGSFRVVAWNTGFADPKEAQVFRITSDGGVEPLGPAIETETTFYNEGAAVSEEGVTWVPFQDDKGAHRLALVGGDGSTSVIAASQGPTPTDRWVAERTARGMRLLRFASEGDFTNLFARETFRLAGADLVPAESHPVEYVDEELLIGSNGTVSWDGGEHWSSGQGARPVPRAPGLGMPRYMTVGHGIAERFSPYLFRKSGLTWPEGAPTNFVVDADRALITWSSTAIHVHEGPLPPPPLAIGELAEDTQAMLSRANLFRADAGLPPLTGHALVSQAARNHSRYTQLNGGDSMHGESPGAPGFTGVWPGNRCEAVGTFCNGEVMHHPGEEDPAGGWLATPFHRSPIASPSGGIVGGGRVDGGWSVMNSYPEAQNLLVRPFGYPNGRWRGPEGFPGEIPDPVQECKASGQPIEYPVGIAVTLFTPDRSFEGAEVNRIEVRARGGSAPLPGCLLHPDDFYGGGTTGTFLLDDPLVPDQTYDARGEWTASAGWWPTGPQLPGTTLSHEWSFTFQPDGHGRGRQEQEQKRRSCRALALPKIKSVAPARRRGRPGRVLGIEERVTLKQKAVVRLRRAQLNYWKAGKRYSTRLPLGKLKRRARRVGRVSYLRLRLPAPVLARVNAGEEAELRLAFSGRRVSGCRRVVQIKRVRKITFGWVRVRGPAAWVSAKRR